MSSTSKHTTRPLRRTFLTLAAVATCAVTTLTAQNAPLAPAKVTTSIDTATITMGERTNFNIEVLKNGHNGHFAGFDTNDSTANLNLDNIALYADRKDAHPTLSGIEIRKIDIDSTDLGNGRIRINYTILLQPFNPQNYIIPAAMYVTDGDTIRSNVTALNVIEPDMPKEMRDSLYINPMRGTLSIESRWYDWVPESWYWWVIGIALAALIVAVILLYRKNGKTLLPVRRRIPPYTLAKNRLDDLKKKRLPEKGHTKAYYTELTDILRQYLGGRFRIYALEMTSSQILDAMRSNPDTAAFVDQLKPMFRVADFVKFAKQDSTPTENIQSSNAVESFIDSTRPVEDNDNKKTADPGCTTADNAYTKTVPDDTKV